MAGNAKSAGGWHASRWRIAGWGGAALLLLVPLVAMQFTDEVTWDLADFVFAGVMLGGAGFAYELAARKTSNSSYRAAVGVALAAVVLLVWVNGAVGIIGNEGNPANLMYGGVLAVGIGGAFVARLQEDAMARALVATAVAQMAVAVIALTAGLGATGPIWPLDMVGATGFFAALWLTSAWLFRKAAREQRPPKHFDSIAHRRSEL